MPTYTEAVYEISSTDEKPLGNLAHNKCYETNTGKFFRWNGEAWVEISLTDQGDINFTVIYKLVDMMVSMRELPSELRNLLSKREFASVLKMSKGVLWK